MALFLEEEYPLPSLQLIKQVSKHFEPASVDVPLYPQIRIIEKPPNQNINLPIIAIVGLLGLFALFGFLAYLRSSK